MSTSTLLHLDASPRSERSHSRKLGHDFVTAWKSTHSGGGVVYRDLGHNPPPFVTEAWVEGAFTPPVGHSTAAQAEMRTSDQFVDELLAADELLITSPIYNLNVPAVLKAWIDQVVRVGRTFGFGANGLEGLVKGKKARIIVASGSDLRLGGAMGGYNFFEPYLRGVLGFIGITDITFVYAHSLNDGNPQRAQSLADADTAVKTLAAA